MCHISCSYRIILENGKRNTTGIITPGNYKDKIAFRDMVRSGIRTDNPEGGEENFDEAVAAVLKSINPWSLRGDVREV
jgi:amyloid beta precursor protein binding protein 1